LESTSAWALGIYFDTHYRSPSFQRSAECKPKPALCGFSRFKGCQMAAYFNLKKSPGICQGLSVCGMGGVHDADNIVHAIHPLVGHERTEAHC